MTLILKWRVCLADLDPVIGSEQGKRRPVMIVSDDALNTVLRVVNVLPITTRKPGRRVYPNEVLMPMGEAGLPNESIVLCHQIRTLDKQRLIKDYGELTDSNQQEAVHEALCFQLGIDR